MEERVIILRASPHAHGATRRFCDRLAEKFAGHGICASLVDLALCGRIQPCVGCGACEATGKCVFETRERAGGNATGVSAIVDTLQTADMLVVASPVYFAGPPASYKALLDRLQPYWVRRYLLGTHPLLAVEERKPLFLAVLGTGGDPFGYEPLITCSRSALRMLDFELAEVTDCRSIPGGRGDGAVDDICEAVLRLAEKQRSTLYEGSDHA